MAKAVKKKSSLSFDKNVEIALSAIEAQRKISRTVYTAKGVIFNWLLFTAFCVGGYFGWRYIEFSFPTLKGWQVVLFGFSAAFVWVDSLRWLRHTKPFNCLPCMSGWATLILAFIFHVEAWYMYVFVGVVVGAVFNGIKMKYL